MECVRAASSNLFILMPMLFIVIGIGIMLITRKTFTANVKRAVSFMLKLFSRYQTIRACFIEGVCVSAGAYKRVCDHSYDLCMSGCLRVRIYG